jgi:hypothetical protein
MPASAPITAPQGRAHLPPDHARQHPPHDETCRGAEDHQPPQRPHPAVLIDTGREECGYNNRAAVQPSEDRSGHRVPHHAAPEDAPDQSRCADVGFVLLGHHCLIPMAAKASVSRESTRAAEGSLSAGRKNLIAWRVELTNSRVSRPSGVLSWNQ